MTHLFISYTTVSGLGLLYFLMTLTLMIAGLFIRSIVNWSKEIFLSHSSYIGLEGRKNAIGKERSFSNGIFYDQRDPNPWILPTKVLYNAATKGQLQGLLCSNPILIVAHDDPINILKCSVLDNGHDIFVLGNKMIHFIFFDDGLDGAFSGGKCDPSYIF